MMGVNEQTREIGSGLAQAISDAEVDAAARAMRERVRWRSLHWPDLSAVMHKDVLKALARSALEGAAALRVDNGRCGGCRDLGPHRNVPACDFFNPESVGLEPEAESEAPNRAEDDQPLQSDLESGKKN